VGRLANLDQAHPHVLHDVEQGLRRWLEEQERGEKRRVEGMTAVSAILAAASESTKRQIMANVARHDGSLAKKLDAAPHVPRTPHAAALRFSDLSALNDGALMTVIGKAAPEVVVLALVGAEASLAERVASRLPNRQRKALSLAMAHLGPTRLSDIEEAQQVLAAIATELTLHANEYVPAAGRFLSAA